MIPPVAWPIIYLRSKGNQNKPFLNVDQEEK